MIPQWLIILMAIIAVLVISCAGTATSRAYVALTGASTGLLAPRVVCADLISMPNNPNRLRFGGIGPREG